MDAVIEEGISQHKLPGAVVLVGRKGKVVWRKAYGARALEPAREPMSTDTIFDLASLTKVDTDRHEHHDPRRTRQDTPDRSSFGLLPELKGAGRDVDNGRTIANAPTGLAPDFDLRERWTGYDEAIKRLITNDYAGNRAPASYTVTSTTSHNWARSYTVSAACRSMSSPGRISSRRWECATLVLTGAGLRPRIAPTEEKRRGQMNYLGDRYRCGALTLRTGCVAKDTTPLRIG